MDNAASKWESYKQTMVVPPSLWSAAKANDVAELTRLLDAGADIDACDARGYSALMLAAYSGNGEAFEYLLSRGANPSSTDASGNSVLMGAAFKGHTAMVVQLLSAGASPHARNHAGLNARDFAEQFGRADVAKLLERTGVAPAAH
jgi:ankyrin repeat protein